MKPTTQNTKYKLNEYHIFKYANPPVEKENQYEVGQSVTIYDGTKRITKYEVIKSNQFKILGKITNTYGHKRRK